MKCAPFLCLFPEETLKFFRAFKAEWEKGDPLSGMFTCRISPALLKTEEEEHVRDADPHENFFTGVTRRVWNLPRGGKRKDVPDPAKESE